MVGLHLCSVQRPLLGGAAVLKRPAIAARPCRNACRKVNTSALALPDQYGYVMASVATTALVAQWMAVRVVLARKECGVSYPAMYAEGTSDSAAKFNCTQRAHQNTLETLPMALACSMLLGLQYPLYAAGLGMAWNVGRIIYALGYSTGDPKARTPGSAITGIVYIVLVFSTLISGGKLALGM